MKLTDVKCKTAKAKEKPYKLPDGNGLYLYVTGTGVKSWRYNYRIHGKEKTYTLGKYPQITLVEARDTHKQLHKKVTQGFDPMLEKKHAKIVGGENAANTFEAIAREWHEHKQSEWTDKYSFTIIRVFYNILGSCRQTGEAMTPGKVAPGGASALAPAKTAHQGVSTAAAPRATRAHFTCLPT